MLGKLLAWWIETKEVALCVLGAALGCAYLLIGWIDFQDITGFLLIIFTLPAIWFARFGQKLGIARYESDWDFLFFLIPLIAVGAELTMFIVKMAAIRLHIGWLPDVVVCSCLGASCFRRSYLWFKVLRASHT